MMTLPDYIFFILALLGLLVVGLGIYVLWDNRRRGDRQVTWAFQAGRTFIIGGCVLLFIGVIPLLAL